MIGEGRKRKVKRKEEGCNTMYCAPRDKERERGEGERVRKKGRFGGEGRRKERKGRQKS